MGNDHLSTVERAISVLLGFVNLLAAARKLKCFDCGKRLRLKLVKKDGVCSIECSCCWGKDRRATCRAK
jgi:hypothetical protein